jgi:RecB family exonuclease
VTVSGSGLERYVNCAASAVLPKIWTADGSDHADRGTETHAHLERVSRGMDPAESLARVDEAHRDAAAAVDLDALAPELALSAEVSIAYNPHADTARVIGEGLGRDYSSVTADEVPMTLDVVGVAEDRVIVGDYKTGHGRIARAAQNWQMIGGALGAARAFDRPAADVQLVHIRDGRKPWRDRATFDALDLAGFAAELRATTERTKRDRERHAAGEHVEPTEGPWCKYCPSRDLCPAKVGLLRSALGADDNMPVTAADAGELWERIEASEKALKHAKSKLIAMASHEPLLLRIEPDGTTVWLGKRTKKGNESLDATIAIDVAASHLAADPAALTREVAGLDVTKAALERAIKARGLKVATTMDAILADVRACGGATREAKESIGIYTTKD